MRRSFELALLTALLVTAAAARNGLGQDVLPDRGALEDLAACMVGPDVPIDPACLDVFDGDGDADVDLHDLAGFQMGYIPSGACCFDDLSCQVLTETGCQVAGGGGQWLGPESDCGQCVLIRIRAITFGGTGSYTIKHDCANPPCSSYGTQQWLDANHDGDVDDAGDHDYPVAYVRNSHVTLSGVQFYVEPAGSASGVPVQGSGPDGLTFAGTGNLSGSTLSVSGSLVSDGTLPNVIRYYPSFDIHWEVALDGVHFYDAGTSRTCLYATRATPLGDGLESYFYISTQAADGLSDEQDMIDAIWAEFADLEVYNAEGERLGYYRGVLCASYCTYYTAPELVYYTTSQCGGWADLLMQCFRTQGLGSSQFITIEPQGYPVLPLDCASYPSSASGFLVKNYSFGSFGTTCASYPYSFNDPCGYYSAWPAPTCADAPGLAGQDNPNPASWFARHFIVKINGAYYDPSYGAGPFTGTTEQANQQWELGAMAGYFGVAQTSPTRAGVRKDVSQTRETSFSQ
jgi:hypothetical protein